MTLIQNICYEAVRKYGNRTAFDSLNEHQLSLLGRFGDILPISIPTIETIGGGSVRCMMAEIFLDHLVEY